MIIFPDRCLELCAVVFIASVCMATEHGLVPLAFREQADLDRHDMSSTRTEAEKDDE